jgi:hypothetical protein
MYLHEVLRSLKDFLEFLHCIPIYVIIPKEEIRDVEKDPRDLAFPPVWFVILTIMFEKMFFLDTMQSWAESPIRVGIPLPQFWYAIIHWLTCYERPTFKTLYCMWDAKQFDRSHPIEITLTWHELMQLKQAISIPSSKEHRAVLDYISFWSCIRIVLLPDGRLVLVTAGIYSGDVSTTNKNSYFHLVRLALCWKYIFGSFDGFRTFIVQSGLSIFGDDAVCAAHCQAHVYFLEKLPEAWAKTSGGILKVFCSHNISEVSFLGKRALGDNLPKSLIPVTSDMDRQIASLVMKNKPSQNDPLKRLSKLVAHRQLLAGFAYDSGTCSQDTANANMRGRDNLQRLDLAIKMFVNEKDQLMLKDPSWVKLKELGLMDAKSLCSYLLGGSDIPIPESLRDIPRGVIEPQSLPPKDNMYTGNKILCRMSQKQKKTTKTKKQPQSTGASLKTLKKKLPSSNALIAKNQRSGNSTNAGGGEQFQKKSYSIPALSAATAAYGMSLMNPGDDNCNGAKVVSMVDQDSGVINSKVVLTAGCPSVLAGTTNDTPQNQTGSGFFVGRPGGLFMSYMYTPGTNILGWNPTGESYSPGAVVYSAQNTTEVDFLLNMGFGGVMDADTDTQVYPNGNPNNAAWMSLPDAQMIQGLSSKKRVVSAGVEVSYIGPPITGSGQLAFGLVPWDQFKNIQTTLNGPVGTQVYTPGLTWDQLINLEGVQVVPAMNGCHQTWYPYDASGTDYQESVATYIESIPTATDVPPVFYPNRAQVKEAFLKPGFMGRNRGTKGQVTKWDPKANKRPATQPRKPKEAAPPVTHRDKRGSLTVIDDYDDVVPEAGYDVVNSFVGTSWDTIFPMDGDQQEMGAFFCSTATAGQLIAAAGGTGDPFTQNSQDIICVQGMEMRPCQGQPLIVVAWSGVAPSDAVVLENWAANLFQITYYVNHEIIPDQNTFRIAEMPLSVSPGAVGSPGVAISAAKAVGPAGPGPLPKKESTWKKFMNWTKGAINTGKKIAGYVGKAAQVAEGIGDVLAAFV